MPLTPADVHNVGFAKPPIGRRGYDQDDVDALLEDVERELTRLIEENRHLRAEIDSPYPGSPPDTDQRLIAENDRLWAQLEQLREESAAAQRRLRRLREELRSQSVTGEQQALQVLLRAHATAEEHLADARREAENLLSHARVAAQQTTDEARAAAESLEREVRARYREEVSPLEERVSVLQARIEQLKTFERENQARLVAYVRNRLADLAAPPDDGPTGQKGEPGKLAG